jgi:hypothetical protein
VQDRLLAIEPVLFFQDVRGRAGLLCAPARKSDCPIYASYSRNESIRLSENFFGTDQIFD